MENQEVIYWILGGLFAILFYYATEMIKLSRQVAVLQKTVDDLAADVREFLKTEIDTLKEIAKG